MAMDKELYAVTVEGHVLKGRLTAYLHAFGYELAKRLGYREHDGIDAVHWFLIEKYRWPPAQVRALNDEDLRFLLAEEMTGWVLPAELRSADDAAEKKYGGKGSGARTRPARSQAANGKGRRSSKSPK